VAGGQAQARGGFRFGAVGEEEAHQSSAVHGGERQPAQLIGDGVTRGCGGWRLDCGAGRGSGEA
jgi:hypothetical protein